MRLRAGAMLAVGLGTTLAIAAPAQGADAPIVEGSASTWSQVLLDQWIADLAPSGLRVAYSGVGSSTGRKDFASYTTDFAITGLGTNRTLAHSVTAGRGSTVLHAELELVAPASTAEGSYTSTLTVTLVGG